MSCDHSRFLLACAGREQGLGEFDEARPAGAGRDEGGRRGDAGQEGRDIGDARPRSGMAANIGASFGLSPRIGDLVQHLFQRLPQRGEQVLQPRQLVPVADPGIDVDGADLRLRAAGAEDGGDALGGLQRQRPGILGEVDGQVEDAEGLVGGDAAAGHGAHRGLPPAPPAGRGRRARSRRPARGGGACAAPAWSCAYQSAPFSPTTAATGQKRAIMSHQPAGRPVTGTTCSPASASRSSAA